MTNLPDILPGVKVRLADIDADKLTQVVAYSRAGDHQRAAHEILRLTGILWAGCSPRMNLEQAKSVLTAVAGALWTDGRMMSFKLTTDQLLSGDKSVTRRNGWSRLRAGARLRAVTKSQGLKKGEHPEVLGVVEIVDVRREPLDAITAEDVIREGFPTMSASDFVSMFCRHMKGTKPESLVTRIEFKLVHRFDRRMGP